MSLRQPSTSPPVGPFGVSLDRYSGRVDSECPECGEVGIDIWIDEGAVEGRGVCVECGADLDVEEVDSR